MFTWALAFRSNSAHSSLSASTQNINGVLPNWSPVSHALVPAAAEKSHKVNALKILTLFLFLFSNKMLTIRAGFDKMLVKRTNRVDPDQTASSEAV